MKKWVIGDIHGNFLGLKQCLNKSNFDYENDLLITLGDICDGYSQVYECVEELLKIKNRIDIRGNHDDPFLEFLDTGIYGWKWAQGGIGTLKSYGFNCIGKDWKDFQIRYKDGGAESNLNPGDIPDKHKDFFKHQIAYYIDDNNLFVHGGFNRHYLLKEQNSAYFNWDRDLWNAAVGYETMISGQDKMHGKDNNPFKIKEKFNKIFIGHTATNNWGTTKPMKAVNIYNIDTGAGFEGKLTIMNIEDTDEYYQSDLGAYLYPLEKGRRK